MVNKIHVAVINNGGNRVEISVIVFRDFSTSFCKLVSSVVQRDPRVPRDPMYMYSTISVSLIVADALPKILNEKSVLRTSIMVEAQGIVSDKTVCVDVYITSIIIFGAEFDANANRNDFTSVIGGVAQSSRTGVN